MERIRNITPAEIKSDPEIHTYIDRADDSLEALGYTEHSLAHVTKCAEVASQLLTQLGYSRRMAELAWIAGWRATYYHEFSHIIDAYLAWDASKREDALFSEETWNSLNPDWFAGYSLDYSNQQTLQDHTSFIDSYSTINPTEDRARVLEYSMEEYCDGFYEDGTVLQAKLSYYCRCIRDAFDTTGWPDTVIWEQYLP